MVRPALALAVTVAIVGAIAHTGFFAHLDGEALRARIESYGALAPLAFMGLMMVGFFVPGPELVLIALGGAIFGALEGFVYGWIAAVVGTAIPFLLVRHAVGRYVQGEEAIPFRRLRALDRRLAERGFVTVLVLRLVLCMAPPLNWALGATRVRLRDYLLGTALGITPGIGLGAYLGDAATDVGSWAALGRPAVLVPATIMLLAGVGATVVGRRVFGSVARPPHAS